MKKNPSFFLHAVLAGVVSVLTSGIACADNVFVTNNGNNTVEEISGNTVTSFIADDLNSPTGIAIDGGNVFVANNGSGANEGYIAEFTLTGAFEGDYSTGENGPRGIAFDSAGNLYVSNQTDGTIVEIPVGGGGGTVIASGLNYSNGLAFDSSGNLYVTSGGGSFIDEISFSSPGVVAGINPFVTTGLNSPNGIAFDSEGNLLVVNHNTTQVLAFTSSGSPLGSVISNTTSLDQPKTIAIDPTSGDFYVTDPGDNTVTEYTSGGVLIQTFATDASGNSAFSGPCFVTTVDPVPEPATCALFIAGLGLLFFMSRRQGARVARVTVK